MFLLDTSFSVGASMTDHGLAKTMDFTDRLVKKFKVGFSAGDSRVAVATFSDRVKTWFDLSASAASGQAGTAGLIQNVAANSRAAGTTHTASGINHVRHQMMQASRGMRPGRTVPKIVIVVTDGGANPSSQAPGTKARELRAAGAIVFSVGVGGYDLSQLRDIASSPAHVHTITSFDALVASVQSIASAVCTAAEEFADLGGCADLKLRAADSCAWTNRG